ncbi:MAG TPA: (2Fe-2S)-binding protein, partial [Dehalococcoidia bacterium]|nr:(2Fe-2S)-binding protein [Dehalococcoidia bacterium]
MPEKQLMSMVRREVENLQEGRIDLAPEILEIPAADYYDQDRWEVEVERIFKRLPMALGFSSELREPGSYRAMEVVGVPVLIVRGDDNQARAFVNMCSHRGNYVVEDEGGQTNIFRCNYHSWTYNLQGDLAGVFDENNFGEFDRSCYGLTPLPTSERSGLIWVTLNPNSNVNIDTFLSGYGQMLEDLKFADAHVVGRQDLNGPNWKVAYDGYRDFYHLPILHRNSFGPDGAFQPDYYAWGPHVRVVAPKNYEQLADTPEEQWQYDQITGGVWTIFPNISIAGGTGGGYMISQMFPGKTPLESHTTQSFLRFEPKEEQDQEEIDQHMDFMRMVVGDEDYYTGFHIQKALTTGAKDHLLFGRNETGGQLFH